MSIWFGGLIFNWFLAGHEQTWKQLVGIWVSMEEPGGAGWTDSRGSNQGFYGKNQDAMALKLNSCSVIGIQDSWALVFVVSYEQICYLLCVPTFNQPCI